MKVYHRTDSHGRSGILLRGFAHDDPPAGPAWDAPDRGYAWFGISKEKCRETCNKAGWWAELDVPDDTTEHMLDDDQPYPGVYRLGHRWLNERLHLIIWTEGD
jgi:hypothetical protein